MNCRTSRRLMHLDRPGERTERETANLREHLNHCPNCSAEASKIEQAAELEQRLRSAHIPVPDLTGVRTRVLVAISGPEPGLTFRPRAARFAYALALTAVLAWFGGEQWLIRSSHAALVERSVHPVPPAAGPQIVYSVDAGEARRLAARGGPFVPEIPASGALEVPQAMASDWIDNVPTYVLRTLVRRPDREAQVADVLKALQSVVEVTIRYRSKGA